MGVKDLWKILSKARRSVDMKELGGKTIAVDLSCWICQFSSVKGIAISAQKFGILISFIYLFQ